jgi:hypothetical protein
VIRENEENCMASFWNLGQSINYYYPPDDGFLAANGKKLLHDSHADSSTNFF